MFDLPPYASSLDSGLDLGWFWVSFANPNSNRRVSVHYPNTGEAPFAIVWAHSGDTRSAPLFQERMPVDTEEEQKLVWDWLLGPTLMNVGA